MPDDTRKPAEPTAKNSTLRLAAASHSLPESVWSCRSLSAQSVFPTVASSPER